MDIIKIEALRNGNHKIFEEIFILYFRRVKIFIQGIIKSEADAQELAQDVFIKLWVNRAKINPEKSLNAYIYTIARNSSLNFLKHKLVEQSYIHQLEFDIVTNTPEEIIYAKEIELLIEMSVSKMPIQRRRIYDLSRKKCMSNEDIAIQLNINKKTVENQLSLVIRELRKIATSFLSFL